MGSVLLISGLEKQAFEKQASAWICSPHAELEGLKLGRTMAET